MTQSVNRRGFIKSAFALPLCAGTGFGARPGRPVLKVSLNAYSFNKLLNDSISGAGATLLQVLEFAAKVKFDGLDATGYYFPGYPAVPANAYVDEFKRRAADLGVGISGTGVRNNFTTSDNAVRDASVKHIKEWVEVAARLGAPVIRVFADTQMRGMTWEAVSRGFTRDQVQEWIAADLRECARHGQEHGVKIGVQNHGDFLKTGQEQLSLIAAVGSDWCGPILDIGSFKTSDPYRDIALVAPHAVNWQIKQRPFGDNSETPTDLIRLMTIVRKSGYSGYLPIETLTPRGKDYDPYAVVPEFLKEVRGALAHTA